MVYRKYSHRHHRRRTRRGRRRTVGLAVRPTFMPRALKAQRFQQVSTKTFYFKDNGTILANVLGNSRFDWLTQNLTGLNPPAQFPQLKGLYEEYKVLAMFVRIFPANVGTEPFNNAVNPTGPFNRGDTIVWQDQAEPFKPPTATISDVINTASCRMISSRRPYKRVLFRPRGYPKWGVVDPATPQPDLWNGAIHLLVEGTSLPNVPPAQLKLWYWTRCYKVAVRGRTQT